MEGNGHLGPEKSGSKIPKSAAKTPIGHANSVLCAIKVPCAVRTAHIEFEFSLHAVTVLHDPCLSKCPFPIGVLVRLSKHDFSGPKWPFPSILFAKRSKMTPSFKIMQSWRGLELHA